MQITDAYTLSLLQQNVNASSTAYNQIQEEVSSGKSINEPSDNPAGTSQAIALQTALTNNTQYQTDASSASSVLSQADSTLTSVSNLLASVQSIATQGASSTNTQSDFDALATQVGSALTEMTSYANTQVAGQYIFSGTATTTAPYSTSDPTYTYQGNDNAINAQIGPSQTIQTNVPGSQVFTPVFTALTQLQSDLTAGNITAISNDLTSIQTAQTTVESAQATVGSTEDQVNTATSQLTQFASQYNTDLSNITDVDLATAAVQLQSDQNTYQAALVATSRAYQYSLADYISGVSA